MALNDLVITPANVKEISGVSYFRPTDNADPLAAVAINAGDSLAVNSSNEMILANAGLVETANKVLIALSNAAIGQRVRVAQGGVITFGSGLLTVGVFYTISINDGKIAPESDIVPGNIATIMGYGLTADNFQISSLITGLARG